MNIHIKKIEEIKDTSIIDKVILNKINGYNSEKRKLESLNGYYLLFTILKQLNITDKITYSKNGKPYFKNNKIYFNISHSYEYVAVVISETKVGIDLEKIDEKILKVKTKFSNLKTNNINKLTKEWTLKEAFIKYNDKTILNNLKDIKIINKFNYYKIKKSDETLYAKTIKFNTYYLSVVTSHKIKNIKIIKS